MVEKLLLDYHKGELRRLRSLKQSKKNEAKIKEHEGIIKELEGLNNER